MSCRIMEFKICIFWQHSSVNTNFIKHNRYFIYIFSLGSVRIPVLLLSYSGELIYVLSIVVCIPSTFCLILSHHQGMIYYKSDVTFVLPYYNCVRACIDVILRECNLSLHEITSVFQNAVIFMSCRIMEFKICIFWQHFFVNTNVIKHNRHVMSIYFLLNPFEFPYYFYRIRGELIYVLSIVVCIPSTFYPTLGHHQGRIYYKSDVTFVLLYYYCVRACIYIYIYIYI